MAEEPPPDTSKLQVAAALLASSVIGAPLVIATAVQTLLFTINPRDLGVSHPLAYAAEIGGAFALSALGATFAVAIVLGRLRQRTESLAVLRVPYMILALQIAFAVVAFALFMFTPVL